MSIKTGDKVKFLNDVGGGVITAFLDKNKVMVRTTDGFEIPVMLSELVIDSGNFMPDKKSEEPETPVKRPEFKSPPKKNTIPAIVKTESKDEELCFAILPKTQSSDLFAYMINNSSYNIHYVISLHGEEETLLFDQGSMESRTLMKINALAGRRNFHAVRQRAK